MLQTEIGTGERVKRRRRVAGVKRHRQLIGGKLYRFDGLDMRTRRARRLKEILSGLIAEFGAANPHSLRELASYRLELDAAVEANLLINKPVTREDAVRMSNVAARIERQLRANRPKHAGPSLQDIIAEHTAQSGSAA
jgi:hypothetical protein